MRRPVRRAAWALALALGGCGPIEYISVVTFDAQTALNNARHASADRYAPYEYTSAVEYLHKARELGGYSRYQQAAEYGKKAHDFAVQALAVAREKSTRPDEGKNE